MAGLSVIFKAVDEISSKFDAMSNAGTRALDAFDRVGNGAGQALSRVTQGTSQAADAMDRAAEATDHWTDAVGNYNRDAMQAVWTTEELVEMGYMTEDALNQAANAVEGAGDSMDRLGAAADRASRDMENLGEEAENAGRRARDAGEKAKDPILSLNDILATVGIVASLKAIAGAFEECSQASAEFETNVAKVGTVADTTILSTEQLSRQISDLSIDTAKNVNELADATYNAISAGVNTADAVSTVGDATKLATAGFTDSSSALSVLTTALNAYQLEASEVTEISDSLIVSQNLGVLTIDQMAHSMGKAISTASAYNVNLYNLESGYISLTKAGISVEESTTYISSMMNELGKSSSKVAKVLVEETGMSFGQLMEQGYSLADVLSVLYDSVDKDSEALMNLWGSAEAGKAGNAIINQGLETFNANLGKLKNSAGTTQKAYEAMTSTTAYSTEKMNNSFHNLSIAIGDDLNPVVNQFQNGIANITDGMTNLINKHPAITAVLTGAAVGIGTVTLAITAYTAVTKIAAVASAALGASMTVALGPLSLLAVAIGAVTAGVIYMANQEDEAVKAQKALTSSSQEMAKELSDLEEQYNALAEAGEADTVEAYQLKNQIDELSAAFENNKQTIGDLIAQNEQYKNVLDNMVSAHEDTMNSINRSESDSKSLIAQLVAMSESADMSGNQLEIMKGIVDRLNGSYEGLNLTLDETNGKLNMTVEDLWKAVTDASAQDKAQANMDALMDYMSQYQEFQRQYDEANKTMNSEHEKLMKVYDDIVNNRFAKDHPFLNWTGWAKGAEENYYKDYSEQYHIWEQAKEATAGAKDNFDALTESIRGCYREMGYSEDEIEDMMAQLALAAATATEAEDIMRQMRDAVEEVSDGYDEAKSIISGYSENIQSLCEAYDAAYESALQSIEGQYKLWDKVSVEASYSLDEIKASLESQKQYWDDYYLHLGALNDRASDIEGLSEMLQKLSDGSEESAAMLSMMAKLDDADLSDLAKQYSEVQEQQKKTASEMADVETEFTAKLDSIKSDMQDMVDSLDLSEEAKTNAMATMDAYVNEIEAGVARAQKAIDSLEFANNTLAGGGFHDYNFGKQTGGSGYLMGYADGTTSAAPGVALVGEEGPELVKFGGGEIVYTTDETANILSRDRSDDDFYVAPAEADDGGSRTAEKNINLRIEGSGEMRVGGNGVSKEDIVTVLMENVKGVLMSIIQDEIIEEGDMAYEY